MFQHVKTPSIPELDSKTSPSGKRFYKTPEGKWYPSITTILGAEEKPELENWRNMLGRKRADKETARCAKRGNFIHEMAEKYLNNDLESLKGYSHQYVNDFNKLKVRLNKVNNIRAQEVALWSDTLGVAGRVDCVGEFEGELSIIDFKTSTRNKYKSKIGDYFLQATAYAIMWHERTGESIDNIAILMTVENGMMPLVFREKIDEYVAPLIKKIRETKNVLQKP